MKDLILKLQIKIRFRFTTTKCMHRLVQAVVILTAFGLYSCKFPVPHRLTRELDCYTKNNTGLDTLINIHGFYTKMVINENEGILGMRHGKFQKLGIDTSYFNFVFFNDGIFVGDISAPGRSISNYLDQMFNGEKTFNDRAFYQGSYSIQGDTIKVQYISPGYSNVWNGYEIWYRIVDKNTIVDFYRKYLGLSASDRTKEAYKPRYYDNANPSRFVFVKNMPESSSWLKKEKWFYCNQ